MAQASNPKSDQEIASRSGIPFQRHVAEIVRNTSWQGFEGPWHVEAEELPVGDSFLDILLHQPGGSDGTSIYVPIEVKRFVDANLAPLRLVFTRSERDARRRQPPTFLAMSDGEVSAAKFRGAPQFHLANNCHFSERRGSEDLNGIARSLIHATRFMASTGVDAHRSSLVIPTVVTNAELRLLTTSATDLETGTLTDSPEDGESVEWIQYTKTLDQASTGTECGRFREWAEERMRSIAIVRATSLIKFLRELEIY